MSDKPISGHSVSPVKLSTLPLTWLWDCRPLADESWGNITGFNDGTPPGHTIEIRRWIRKIVPTLMNISPNYRPAFAPLPPMYASGGVRRYYVPSPADIEIVRKHFPEISNPYDPSWPTIREKVMKKGYYYADLEHLSPPKLLALLDATAAPSTGTKQNKEGKAAKRKGVPLDEANVRVREWLAANAKQNPAAVTRDAVAEGTGVSTGQVSNTPAWKAFCEQRKMNARLRTREVPLTKAMQSVIQSACERPDELAALIEEQKADETKQKYHHKRRHRPS